MTKAAAKSRGFFLMMADTKDEVAVLCPACGRFAFRGKFVRVETVCNDRQCRTSFVATVDSEGIRTVTILQNKRRA